MTTETRCCIVGGGPAGVILAYLLARKGVPTVLLEAHHDFDRDFRGDTVHPSTLDVLQELGLAERLHQLPHGKMRRMMIYAAGEKLPLIDFGVLGCSYPYVMMLSQALFLDFMVQEARQFPAFTLQLGARVNHLIQEGGKVRGVRYEDSQGHEAEVRALLVVGADGRFSKLRTLAGLIPERTSPPMDVVWFRLPREERDPAEEGGFHVGYGRLVVLLTREKDWLIGYVIPKGSFQKLKADGIAAISNSIAAIVPWLAGRIGSIQDWSHFSVLSVESSRLPKWYIPGLLLIGDAAHVMSPVGGVGINYAIQDAVEAANILAGPLSKGEVNLHHLQELQRRREWPVKIIRRVQALIQKRIVGEAFESRQGFHIPLAFRLVSSIPLLNRLPARMIGYGPRPAHIEH